MIKVEIKQKYEKVGEDGVGNIWQCSNKITIVTKLQQNYLLNIFWDNIGDFKECIHSTSMYFC